MTKPDRELPHFTKIGHMELSVGWSPAVFYSCRQEAQTVSTVKNKLDIDRASETISIPADRVKALLEEFGAYNMLVLFLSARFLMVSGLKSLDIACIPG